MSRFQLDSFSGYNGGSIPSKSYSAYSQMNLNMRDYHRPTPERDVSLDAERERAIEAARFIHENERKKQRNVNVESKADLIEKANAMKQGLQRPEKDADTNVSNNIQNQENTNTEESTIENKEKIKVKEKPNIESAEEIKSKLDKMKELNKNLSESGVSKDEFLDSVLSDLF